MSGTTFAAISFVVFGFWGFAAKLAVNAGGWRTPLMFAWISNALLASGLFVTAKGFTFRGRAIWLALLTGALGTLGILFFNLALSKAPASRVIPITALYPALTVVLSWLILSEELTLRHMTGIAFALVGVVLLA